jgi:uncharacterized protein
VISPRAEPDAILVPVRVKPRARNTGIAGERDGRLLLEVTAPPVAGRANEAVCRLLAKALRIAPTRVSVVAGDRTRDKTVRIEGITQADLARVLGSVSTE